MLDLQNLRELGRGAGEGGLHCRLTLWLNNITEIFDNVWLVAPRKFKTCCGLCTLKAKNSIKRSKPDTNTNTFIIHSPQGFSGIIYNTMWGTFPDCLWRSLHFNVMNAP